MLKGRFCFFVYFYFDSYLKAHAARTQRAQASTPTPTQHECAHAHTHTQHERPHTHAHTHFRAKRAHSGLLDATVHTFFTRTHRSLEPMVERGRERERDVKVRESVEMARLEVREKEKEGGKYSSSTKKWKMFWNLLYRLLSEMLFFELWQKSLIISFQRNGECCRSNRPKNDDDWRHLAAEPSTNFLASKPRCSWNPSSSWTWEDFQEWNFYFAAFSSFLLEPNFFDSQTRAHVERDTCAQNAAPSFSLSLALFSFLISSLSQPFLSISSVISTKLPLSISPNILKCFLVVSATWLFLSVCYVATRFLIIWNTTIRRFMKVI